MTDTELRRPSLDESESGNHSFEVEEAGKRKLIRKGSTSSDGATTHHLPPPKTTCAALTMLVLGVVLIISGAVIYFGPANDTSRGLPIFLLGGISKWSDIAILSFSHIKDEYGKLLWRYSRISS
jgi:hypothetical protein